MKNILLDGTKTSSLIGLLVFCHLPLATCPLPLAACRSPNLNVPYYFLFALFPYLILTVHKKSGKFSKKMVHYDAINTGLALLT